MPKYVPYLKKSDIVRSYMEIIDRYYKYDRKVMKYKYFLLGMLVALEE